MGPLSSVRSSPRPTGRRRCSCSRTNLALRPRQRPGRKTPMWRSRCCRISVSVLMSRDGFYRWRNDMELAEVARIALTDERRVMSDQLMAMLDGKFENPMLGVFGAHILLLSLDRAASETTADRANAPAEAAPAPRLELPLQAKDLDVIVQNLRRLVGDRHPDVEALSLRASDPALRHRKPLTEPPMLRRSWSLFVAASNDAPSLCPPELWKRIRQMRPAPPYLTWLPATSRADPVHDLLKRMAPRAPAVVKRARRQVAAVAAPVPSRQVAPGGSGRGRAHGRAAPGARIAAGGHRTRPGRVGAQAQGGPTASGGSGCPTADVPGERHPEGGPRSSLPRVVGADPVQAHRLDDGRQSPRPGVCIRARTAGSHGDDDLARAWPSST